MLKAKNEDYYNKNSELESKLMNNIEKEKGGYVFQSTSLNNLINISKPSNQPYNNVFNPINNKG